MLCKAQQERSCVIRWTSKEPRLARDCEKDLQCFYATLGDLEHAVGKQLLKDCNGRMNWPRKGVYFFFENGEFRRDGATPRVVRVGTHAVSKGSRTTLWNRLSTHRGTRAGGGNHRGSIFRLHVGAALLARNEDIVPKVASWAKGSSAPRDVRKSETHVERAVSSYIGTMPFLWIEADDKSGKDSIRRFIEANAIALLSRPGVTGAVADPPSESWLGHYCPNEKVRRSGLWNANDTDGRYDPAFLLALARSATATRHL